MYNPKTDMFAVGVATEDQNYRYLAKLVPLFGPEILEAG